MRRRRANGFASVIGRGDDDEEKGEPELLEIITVTVTDETREIAGVETFIVNWRPIFRFPAVSLREG